MLCACYHLRQVLAGLRSVKSLQRALRVPRGASGQPLPSLDALSPSRAARSRREARLLTKPGLSMMSSEPAVIVPTGNRTSKADADMHGSRTPGRAESPDHDRRGHAQPCIAGQRQCAAPPSDRRLARYLQLARPSASAEEHAAPVAKLLAGGLGVGAIVMGLVLAAVVVMAVLVTDEPPLAPRHRAPQP
jgi:hypothetical protein